MSFSQTERHRLADLFLKLGPEAPTLCEGWTTQDLAAHLYLRENRPDAALGMFISRFAPHEEKLRAQLKDLPFEELVEKWRRGPQVYNPTRYIDSFLNTAEHFIHHEDVRRANGEWEPREFSQATNEDLAKYAYFFAKKTLKDNPVPVHLVPTGQRPRNVAGKHGVVAQGNKGIHIFGDAGELLLFAAERNEVQIQVEGTPNSAWPQRSSI